MNENNPQGGQPMEPETVRQFYKLLVQNRPDAGQDYPLLLQQANHVTEHLRAAAHKLAEARRQLTRVLESPEKERKTKETAL